MAPWIGSPTGIWLHRGKSSRNLRCIPALRPTFIREAYLDTLVWGHRFRITLLGVGRPCRKGVVVIQSLHDRVCGFLRFRIERAPPRRGPKPAIGAYVVCGELRMTIQAGVSDDLWEWLMGQGWRELRYAPDRRHYLRGSGPLRDEADRCARGTAPDRA